MQKEVFISFASKDQAVANATCKAIEDRGYSCWISSRDVRPGRDYAEEITDAIEDCKLMVFVFSQNSNNSDEVKREITLASQNLKIVIPLLTEDIKMSPSFRYHLATRNWIDCSQGWEASLEILFSQLEQIISEEKKKSTVANKASRGYLADAINDSTKIPLKGAGSKAKLKNSRVREVNAGHELAETNVTAEILAPTIGEPAKVADTQTKLEIPKFVPIAGALAAGLLVVFLLIGAFGKNGKASSGENGVPGAKDYAKTLVGNWVEASSGQCGRDNAQISLKSDKLSWKTETEIASEFSLLSVENGWLRLSDDVQIQKDGEKLRYKFGGANGGVLEYKSCP
ncbi:MAG: hypothetical protein FD163_1033 [Hyphomonadaceae bacterium]|nr:MAG: hypothetical protein FD163_1033 [Hyphomonadaceae bacterium]